ncbi:MAG: hypothetical protein VX640_14275 [Pseudomonadota bacterium]|nr:hypothetical protein [Pseudomonadota bacterium]
MPSTVLTRPAAFYDVVPIDQRYAGPHTHSPFEVFRKFGQGAGAAWLVLTGSDAMLSPAAADAAEPVVDFSSLNGIAESLATGGLTGPLQIIGAILIFLAAGRCIARFAGLIIMAGVFVLYTQGVTIGDIGSFAGDFMHRAAAAAQAFMSEPVA